MNPLLKKMNYKEEKEILCINVPSELKAVVEEFRDTVAYKEAYDQANELAFAIIFVLSQEDINEAVSGIKDKFVEDVKLWFCYPKKSSKKYKCEINRDTGWGPLGELGFEPVRQVSFSDDFSALRFRQVDKIKTLTRSKEMAMTKEAKDRTSGK